MSGGPALGDLARRQADLVAALVGGAPLPSGFDARAVAVAADALLVKRAGEVARAWPRLAAAYGGQWRARFAAWARGRPPGGPFLDGWDFARSLSSSGELPGSARAELAAVEVRLRRGPDGAIRRRLPAARLLRPGVVVCALGRTRRIGTG